MRDAARNQKHSAGMKPMHAAPCRRDQKCAHAAAIEISHRHRIKTECVAGNPASVCPEEMSIFARVEISPSSTNSRSGVLPSTYDEIGVAVPVDISRDGWTGAESLTC